jgi:hypothetical protein
VPNQPAPDQPAPEAAAIADDANAAEEEEEDVLERVKFLIDQCDDLLTHKSNFLGNIPWIAGEWRESIPPLGDIALPSPEAITAKIKYFDRLHTRSTEVACRTLLGYAAADLRGRVAEVGQWTERVTWLRSEVAILERRIRRAELAQPRMHQEEQVW